MHLTDEEKKYLDKVAKSSEIGLKSSKIFLGIGTEEYYKDPVSMLQIGMAVLMDKPIYLLVPHGTNIPRNLKVVATHIEYYGPNELIEKTDKIIKIADLL